MSEIQFPNNVYNIRNGYNKIIKQDLYNNIEGELEKIRNAAWKYGYVYQESIEVFFGIYNNIEQVLYQHRNKEHKNIRNIDYSCHPITQKIYTYLVENCRLDFNNLNVGCCL